MSASKRTRDAASSVKALITRLRSAGQYAEATNSKPLVDPFLRRAHELYHELLGLAERLERAELRRRVATRNHGRAA